MLDAAAINRLNVTRDGERGTRRGKYTEAPAVLSKSRLREQDTLITDI